MKTMQLTDAAINIGLIDSTELIALRNRHNDDQAAILAGLDEMADALRHSHPIKHSAWIQAVDRVLSPWGSPTM